MSENSISVGGSSKYAKAFTVPQEFPETLRTLVREILRNQPQNAHEIHKFGTSFLSFSLSLTLFLIVFLLFCFLFIVFSI